MPRQSPSSRHSATRSRAGLVPADQRFLCAGAGINLALALLLFVVVNGSALLVGRRDENAKLDDVIVGGAAVVLCLFIVFVDFRLWSLFTDEARSYVSTAAGA